MAATVDSEYRFTNVFWLAAGLALWWSLRQMPERRTVTRVTLIAAFFGGIARMVSALATGWPHPVFIGVLGLELVIVPLVLWWHARVVGPAGIEPTTSTV